MFEKCLFFNSNALARTVSRLWIEAYQQFDLSPHHAYLLRVVLAKPGLLPRELAEELDLSRSTVTRFLNSLEERGFLVRKPTGKDGREVHIYPTSKSEAIHEQLNQTSATLTKQLFQAFGEGEILQMVENLRKIKDQLDA